MLGAAQAERLLLVHIVLLLVVRAHCFLLAALAALVRLETLISPGKAVVEV